MRKLRLSTTLIIAAIGALARVSSVAAQPYPIEGNPGVPGDIAALQTQIAVLESQVAAQDVTITALQATNAELVATVETLQSRSLVPRTGQTACWDNDGSSVTCLGARQDGSLQAGVAWPSPRFVDNGDGTVTDELTGLVWLRDASSDCFEVDSDVRFLWDTAVATPFFLASGACGLSDGSTLGDWRLPSARELYSLVDLGRYDPALPSGHPFTGVSDDGYWSSTTFNGSNFSTHTDRDGNPIEIDESWAWSLGVRGGLLVPDDKSRANRIWPVRDPF